MTEEPKKECPARADRPADDGPGALRRDLERLLRSDGPLREVIRKVRRRIGRRPPTMNLCLMLMPLLPEARPALVQLIALAASAPYFSSSSFG